MKTNGKITFILMSTVSLITACAFSQKQKSFSKDDVINSSIKIDRFPADTGIVAEALPPVKATAAEQNAIWTKYCNAKRDSVDVPVPNYKNLLVKTAAEKLAMIESQSFYFYSGPLKAYGLKINGKLIDPPSGFPVVNQVTNGKKNAHAFLTLLCGEFRDRPTLIEEKLRWVNKINKLAASAQMAIGPKDHVWSKMTAESYQNYIMNSKAIYDLKKRYQLQSENSADSNSLFKPVVMGKYSEETPVEPFTVCETKYIFQNYVVPKVLVNSTTTYDGYKTAYNNFKVKCDKQDLDYIYDFRGDSNFKPNSPESNGMIWYASTIAGNCVRKDGKLVLSDKVTGKITNTEICNDYFKAPFAHRWSAARAGLATWLFNSKALDEVFSTSYSNVTIIPNYDKLDSLFDHKSELETTEKVMPSWMQNKNQFWKQSDLGFNQITGLGTVAPNKEMAFEKLRNSVNRHTDWYASGYNDQVGPEKTEAYSPFVASSYEMSASDAFTAPGITVNSPADGCKHWMFVFKLRKDQWYNNQSIEQNQPVDFNTHWFDETSLGTNHLADSERAFDRLGTALEGETDSILYLNNLTTSGQVKLNCGAGFIKAE